MGSIGMLIFALVVGLIILWTVRSFYTKRREADEQHKENMAKIQQQKAEEAPANSEEAEMYIQLFVIYARDHVAKTGRKISSNRLSPLVTTFREGYYTFMTRGLPDMENPYQQIKSALKKHGLMVDNKTGH